MGAPAGEPHRAGVVLAHPGPRAVSHAASVLVSRALSGVSYDAALGTLPGVAASASAFGINAAVAEAGGTLDSAVTVFAPLDGRYGRTMEIPKMLGGRLPAADAPGDVAVDQVAASVLHLSVGSVLRLVAFYPDGSHTRRLTERVTGIFVASDSVVPVNDLGEIPRIMASTALYRELGPAYEAFDGAWLSAWRWLIPAALVALPAARRVAALPAIVTLRTE
ncbi:MAG TPA: hypothetical protein VMI73_06395 [Trebonia sp.]|nr:hypothetical protein [Trebonia sp.]